MSAAEVSECAVIVSQLARRGVTVRVEGGRVVFDGKAVGDFAIAATETLDLRARAVAAALARGLTFGEKLELERNAATAAIRRGRAPRKNHQRKLASGDVPTNNLSAPAAAVASREGDGKPVGPLLLIESPPPTPTFSFDEVSR